MTRATTVPASAIDARKIDGGERTRTLTTRESSKTGRPSSTHPEPDIGQVLATTGIDEKIINSLIRINVVITRAIKIGLYKNGDPWFGAVNFHYLPGRDVTNLDSLFKMINPKMDIMNGNYFN